MLSTYINTSYHVTANEILWKMVYMMIRTEVLQCIVYVAHGTNIYTQSIIWNFFGGVTNLIYHSFTISS